VKLAIEALGAHLGHEFRRLAQQIEAGGVFHLPAAVGGDGQRDAAEHELRVEAVTALLQVTAIGDLGDHVGGAEQVTQHDVALVGHLRFDRGKGTS
jgi:hypothetical protein